MLVKIFKLKIFLIGLHEDEIDNVYQNLFQYHHNFVYLADYFGLMSFEQPPAGNKINSCMHCNVIIHLLFS